MKIKVTKLYGDAAVTIYNKTGELIHTEKFYGKCDSWYERSIPVSEVEYGYSMSLSDHEFKYTVIS